MIQLAPFVAVKQRIFLTARSPFTEYFPHPSDGSYQGIERDLPPMFGLGFRLW